MKKRLLTMAALVLLPALVWAASGLVASKQVVRTNADTAVPARMAAARGAYATSITVIGNKDWRTPNTSTVYIGPTSTNSQQPIAIAPGATATLTFANDQFIDLYDWYFDVGTANDGVVIVYSR